MDVLEKIVKLRDERGWSDYKLAQEAKIPQSTLSNLFKRNNTPTVTTLEAISRAFNISLSQFFADDIDTSLTQEQRELLNDWVLLSSKQREKVSIYIQGLLQK